MLDTDIELLGQLFSQLQKAGLSRLQDVEAKLIELKILTFNDLLNYISGPDCDLQLAAAIEEVIDRLRLSEPKRKPILMSSKEVGAYLSNKLVGHKQEEFWALYLDNGNRIIAEKKISQGTLDRSLVHPRDVFRWAVLFNCASIIAVHNHPSGKMTPSNSDLKLTENLRQSAKMMKIEFLDHFIVGKGRYFSMRENQLF